MIFVPPKIIGALNLNVFRTKESYIQMSSLFIFIVKVLDINIFGHSIQLSNNTLNCVENIN